jgi:predicted TIM-barrel fold metal-dependent hydrolase
MKIITLEEHYLDLSTAKAGAANQKALSPGFGAAWDSAAGLPNSPSAAVLQDLGDGRLADMDANGIDIQVLSTLGAQLLPEHDAAELTRASNNTLAAAVKRNPERFSAFASVPTSAPGAGADELERAVSDLGFVGAMIFGRTEGEFLDAPRFDPVLARAAKLGVPIYLHPAIPPRAVSDANYSGLDPIVATRFETSAWGWHSETAVHFLHLALAGVLDRYPELQFILGHWGEMVPFFLERFDESIPRSLSGLDRTITDYMRQNVFLTPSGLWSQAQLQFCAETIGIDRIMYSVDYPFVANDGAANFLAQAQLPEHDKELIAPRTAEHVLRLAK